MLRKAIEKIVELGQPLIWNENGHTYACYSDRVMELRPKMDMPLQTNVNSLDALAQLIREDDYGGNVFVSVMSATHVEAFGYLEKDKHWDRARLYRADATDIPGWDPDTTLPYDEATVALMTRFQDSPDREYCLQLLSQITTGAKVTYMDNGVASTIVTQKGAALAQNMQIKPLVRLRPYRTFQEVEQPEGIFLIRVKERGISFIEADGGMWKLTARKTIKAWLEQELKDCDGVTIML